jgi:hypothetical protein
MAPYYPVTVCRSDGQLEVITKSGMRELNRPTAEQLSDTPDANGSVDCYKRLDAEDPKAVDWRRKLGGMLMHLLGGKAHSGIFVPVPTFTSLTTCRQELYSQRATRRICAVGTCQVQYKTSSRRQEERER